MAASKSFRGAPPVRHHQATRHCHNRAMTVLTYMLLVGLLKRFGDIPEVHTFLELKRKMFKNEPFTLDERIAYTTAQYHLWPHPETKKTLEIFLERRATKYPRSTKIVR